MIERNRALAAHLGRALRADSPNCRTSPRCARRGMIVAVELARDGDRAHALRLAGAPRPARLPPRAGARGAAAADRQRRLLHAAVRDHPGPDRRAGRDGARRHRGGDMRLTRVFCRDRRSRPAPTSRCPRRPHTTCRACCACAPGAPIVVVRRQRRRLPLRDRRDRRRSRAGARGRAACPGCRESPLAITLVQAVSRGERMDWTLQKATELGVRAIVPVLSARSVVRLDDRQAATKLRHWQAIVAERLRADADAACCPTCTRRWTSAAYLAERAARRAAFRAEPGAAARRSPARRA